MSEGCYIALRTTPKSASASAEDGFGAATTYRVSPGIHMVLWCSLECTPPCQGGGREFKSRQDRFWGLVPVFGRVAQLAERTPEKREVTGSTPVPTTNN